MASGTAPAGFGRAAWTAIRNGHQMHGFGLTPVQISFNGPDVTVATGAATVDIPVFIGGPSSDVGAWKVEAAYLLADTTTAAGANTCTIDIENDVGGPLGGTAFSNVATEITAGTVISLDIDGPESASPLRVFMATDASEAISIRFTRAGTGADYTGTVFCLTVFMRQSPPGR